MDTKICEKKVILIINRLNSDSRVLAHHGKYRAAVTSGNVWLQLSCVECGKMKTFFFDRMKQNLQLTEISQWRVMIVLTERRSTNNVNYKAAHGVLLVSQGEIDTAKNKEYNYIVPD